MLQTARSSTLSSSSGLWLRGNYINFHQKKNIHICSFVYICIKHLHFYIKQNDSGADEFRLMAVHCATFRPFLSHLGPFLSDDLRSSFRSHFESSCSNICGFGHRLSRSQLIVVDFTWVSPNLHRCAFHFRHQMAR